MPIQSAAPAVTPVVAAVTPAVALPVTGAEVAVAPVLSAADAALIAQTKAQFAGNAPASATDATAPSVQPATSGATTAGDTTPTTNEGGDKQPEPELTASQKIAAKIEAKRAQVTKLNAEIEKLEGQFRSADLLDGIKAGSVIVARVGRAETAREVVASVVGVQTLPTGDLRYKVFFGEGFDAETVVIQSSQIVDVKQV